MLSYGLFQDILSPYLYEIIIVFCFEIYCVISIFLSLSRRRSVVYVYSVLFLSYLDVLNLNFP